MKIINEVLAKFYIAKKNMIYILLLVVVFLFCFIRLWFCAELSDEAYSVAEPYIVSKGAIPFVNNWSQTPGWSLLLVPFITIFTMLTGGTEGIMLYMRIVAFVLTFLCMFCASYILKRQIENGKIRWLYLFPNILPLFVITGSITFRCDKPAMLLMWLMGLCLSVSFVEEDRRRCYSVLAGICGALSSLCYGQLIVCCVLMAVVLFVIELKSKVKISRTYLYCLGGLMTALIVVIYFVLRSSLSEVIQGMTYIFSDVAYFQLGRADVSLWLSFLDVIIKIVVCFAGITVIAFVLVYFVSRRISKGNCKQRLLISGTIGVIGSLLAYFIRFHNENSGEIIFFTCLLLYMTAPLFLFFIDSNLHICVRLFQFVWIPSGMWMLFSALTTWSWPLGRAFFLSEGAFLSILYISLAFEDTFDLQHNSCRIQMIGLFPILMTTTMAGVLLFNIYAFSYSNGKLTTLKKQVNSGVYKGIYTTREMADGLVEVEEIIREYTSSDDRVLIMDCFPAGYIMTDAVPCTPSTWDQALYSYGLNDDSVYLDYFEVTGAIPTKIIYINHGITDYLSIETNDYKFNDFVFSNYRRIYSNTETFFDILVFEKGVQ